MKLGDEIEIYVRDFPKTGIRANPPPPTPMIWTKGLYLFEAASIDQHYVARRYLGRWVPISNPIHGEHIRADAIETSDEWLGKLEVNDELQIDVDRIRKDEPLVDEPRIVLTLPQGNYPIDDDGYMTARLLVSKSRRR